MSLWLHTFFDGGARDEAIIKYWLDMRSPNSTALAIIPDVATVANTIELESVVDAVFPPAPDTPEVNPVHEAAAAAPLDAASWLYDNYHPKNLSTKVCGTSYIASHDIW